MTDRYNYLTVVLEDDFRADDCDDVITAIKMVKGVLSVKPNVRNAEDFCAMERVRSEIAQKIWDVLYPKKGKS
jgi:hypothetical protein